VGEQRVAKEEAYILFYEREDEVLARMEEGKKNEQEEDEVIGNEEELVLELEQITLETT